MDDFTIIDVSEGVTYSNKVAEAFEQYENSKISLDELKAKMNEIVTGEKPMSKEDMKKLEKMIIEKLGDNDK